MDFITGKRARGSVSYCRRLELLDEDRVRVEPRNTGRAHHWRCFRRCPVCLCWVELCTAEKLRSMKSGTISYVEQYLRRRRRDEFEAKSPRTRQRRRAEMELGRPGCPGFGPEDRDQHCHDREILSYARRRLIS